MNLTEQERDALIADCKADISCARTLMLAAINIRDRETTAKYESQLRRHEIALASLTAEPVGTLINTFLANDPRAIAQAKEKGMVTRDVYTAPSVPVMKPVTCPAFDDYQPHIARELREAFKAALREAGIQIEGEE